MTAPAARRSRWERLADAFAAALPLPRADRRPLLDGLLGDTGPTRREVEAMLEAHDGGGTLSLERRLLDGAATYDDPPPSLVAGVRLGPWRVTGLQGRGGMAEVYRAERADDAFDQRVAIKVMRLAPGGRGEEWVHRFERERRILARLDHPDIVAILDGGRLPDGRPYLVMPFVDGAPFSAYCDAHRLAGAERAALVARIAHAVASAHARGVVHRDLKPSNVLVGADGRPHLLDFGVATLLGDDGAAETRPGGAPLTPAYAAPEQLRGEPVSWATDVYALGVMLDEALAAGPPDGAGGRSAELARVARRALAPEPAHRYHDAAALADALDRALAGRLGRHRGWSRQPPRMAAGAAAAVTLAGAGLAMTRHDVPLRPVPVPVPVSAAPAADPCRDVPDTELARQAHFYAWGGRPDEARALMDCVVARAESRGGARSVEAARAWTQRAQVGLEAGEVDGPARALDRAATVLRPLPPAADTLRADVDLFLGVVALRRARPDSALTRFRAAADAWAWTGRPHPKRTAASCGMGLALARLGRAEAPRWEEQFCRRHADWDRGYAALVRLLREASGQPDAEPPEPGGPEARGRPGGARWARRAPPP